MSATQIHSSTFTNDNKKYTLQEMRFSKEIYIMQWLQQVKDLLQTNAD